MTLPAVHSQHSLDELWAHAERLGRVEVDHGFGSDNYVVEITFTRPSGTRIYARGKDMRIHFALELAIHEAEELGARP